MKFLSSLLYSQVSLKTDSMKLKSAINIKEISGFIAIFVTIMLTGCNVTQKFSAPVFKSKTYAKVSVLSASDEVLPKTYDMKVSDSLIILSGHLDGKLFHTYDRKTGKSIGHYVNRGQGPDDMIMAGMFYQDENGVVVKDMATQAIKRFDKDWKCVSTVLDDYGKMEKNSPRRVRPMPDGKVFEEVFVEYSMPLGMQIKDGDRYGNVYTKLPVIVDNAMTGKPEYARKYHFSPDAKKMVAVSPKGLIIEIFDIDDIEIRPKAVKFYYSFESNEVVRKEGEDYVFDQKGSNIYGIGAMASTDNRIVAVYNGSYDIDAYTDITVWDWEGKALKRYHANKIISAIALSPDNPDEIYAFGKDKEGEYELLLINCPGLLD